VPHSVSVVQVSAIEKTKLDKYKADGMLEFIQTLLGVQQVLRDQITQLNVFSQKVGVRSVSPAVSSLLCRSTRKLWSPCKYVQAVAIASRVMHTLRSFSGLLPARRSAAEEPVARRTQGVSALLKSYDSLL
jgi:phage tail tube protein FII